MLSRTLLCVLKRIKQGSGRCRCFQRETALCSISKRLIFATVLNSENGSKWKKCRVDSIRMVLEVHGQPILLLGNVAECAFCKDPAASFPHQRAEFLHGLQNELLVSDLMHPHSFQVLRGQLKQVHPTQTPLVDRVLTEGGVQTCTQWNRDYTQRASVTEGPQQLELQRNVQADKKNNNTQFGMDRKYPHFQNEKNETKRFLQMWHLTVSP